MNFVLRLLRLSSPILILAAGIGLYVYLVQNRPEAPRRAPPVVPIEVQVIRLQPEAYRVELRSQGTVRARTSSTLIPEVSGRIVWVSPDFREGGFFDEGDVLVKLDEIDYRTAVTIAEANLAEMRVQLAEEEARSMQARLDWDRLGRSDTPSELVLRGPQLALARANVAASEARLAEARRNLERTRLVAPFAGRVLRQLADIGQVVNTNTVLAELFAVDYAEIRLPLNNRQFSFLELPAVFSGPEAERPTVPVTLSARFGRELHEWEGRIVRIEGAIDTASRQIFVVAQVDKPYDISYIQPLKVGLFVEAAIEGRVLPDVYVLPRTALREARYVVTVNEETNTIRRVAIDPIWTTTDSVVFRSDQIEPGTMVSLTPLAIAVDGMTVRPVTTGRSAGRVN